MGVKRSLSAAFVVALASLGFLGPAPAQAGGATTNLVTYQQIRNWHSGKCVDVDGASQSDSAKIQQYTCNGTIAQQWRKEFTDSGYFKLIVAASGKCLTIENASQANVAKAVQRTCLSRDNFHQQWTEQTSGVPGWPHLKVRHSGKGLVMGSESMEDRVQLIQWDIEPDGPETLHSMDWQFQ